MVPYPTPKIENALIPYPTPSSKVNPSQAVNVAVPIFAETEVVLPTTKFTDIDMYSKRRIEEEQKPKATHQTAPPAVNFPPTSSQTSGEFSTPPPLIVYYPIIKRK